MPIDGKKNACENKEKYPLSPSIGTVVEFDRQSPRSQGSRREITRGNEAINHVDPSYLARGEKFLRICGNVPCIAYLSSREFVWGGEGDDLKCVARLKVLVYFSFIETKRRN